MRLNREHCFWLLKTEPGTFSIDDLRRKRKERWDGVRNYQARNFLRAMKRGDQVFVYHSSTKEPGVFGVGEVAREAYPDPTQYDPESLYYEPKATRDNPRWFAVDIAFVKKLQNPILLSQIKNHQKLGSMIVAKRGVRLSVQPVSPRHARLLLNKRCSF